MESFQEKTHLRYNNGLCIMLPRILINRQFFPESEFFSPKHRSGQNQQSPFRNIRTERARNLTRRIKIILESYEIDGKENFEVTDCQNYEVNSKAEFK